MAILELRDVTVGYGNHTVLRNLDLVVPEGSVVALLGPNGAGKTTLLRAASGLLPLSDGALFVDGVDRTGAAAHRLADAGVCHIPEGRGIFRDLTVADNLRLQTPVAAGRAGAEWIDRLFPRLTERRTQRAGTMSGGEQQMLALARASHETARVVLVDEVSMGLAPKILDEIYDYLRHLVSGGTALLLVEQYVQRALELADYVYVMQKGRARFLGEPAQLNEQQIAALYLGG